MTRQRIIGQLRKKAIFLLAVFIACWGGLGVAALPPSLAAEAIPTSQRVATLFINVGKADCALVICGEKSFLIDTGSKDSAEAMLRALDSYGIQRLNGVLVTHTDKDHVGGLKALLKSDVAVDALYAPKYHLEESNEDHPVWEAADKHGIPMVWLSAGDILVIDEQSRFTVLGPRSLYPDDDNNNSLVLYMETSEGTMLFTGDMEAEEEEELLNAGVIPRADVLKVAHHGKKDSSSERFVYTARPQWAIISTDSQQEPSTPAASVIKRLWAVGAEVAVTQDATCGLWVTLSGGEARGEGIHYPE